MNSNETERYVIQYQDTHRSFVIIHTSRIIPKLEYQEMLDIYRKERNLGPNQIEIVADSLEELQQKESDAIEYLLYRKPYERNYEK